MNYLILLGNVRRIIIIKTISRAYIKSYKKKPFSDYFIDSGITITDKKDVVNGFNNSVDVGPNLAKQINPPQGEVLGKKIMEKG